MNTMRERDELRTIIHQAIFRSGGIFFVGKIAQYEQDTYDQILDAIAFDVRAHLLSTPVVERAAYEMYLDRPVGLDQEGGDDWAILPDDWREEWKEGARAAFQGALRVCTDPIRCDYCGEALPSVKNRADIPTTPDLQRRGFAADKVVCPGCAAHGSTEPDSV